jgi:hypothetical protein
MKCCFVRVIVDLRDERVKHEQSKLYLTSGFCAKVEGTRAPEVARNSLPRWNEALKSGAIESKVKR